MYAPQPDSGAEGRFTTVLRSRVLERIRCAAKYPVTVVAAPAGYGKTVALRQYLQTLDVPFVRYDVRSSEAALLGFLHGLAGAFSAFAPDLLKNVTSAYGSSLGHEHGMRDLAHWMHAHIAGFSGVVAIDDLHIAHEDPQICSFIVELIAQSGNHLRWIIATRSAAALPVASWIAYGVAEAVVDRDDLRLTLEEARSVAAAIAPHIGDAELIELLRVTDAWATALNFALRSSARPHHLHEAAASSRELLYRYLAEQVYRELEDAEKQLLAYASQLHDVHVEVLESAGFADAEALLEALRLRTGFVVCQRPGVYRCHDLFREFLEAQVRLMGSGVARVIQARVAQALRQTGHFARALEACARLGDEARILQMLAEIGFDVYERGNYESIRVAVDALFPQTREQNAIAKGFAGLCEFMAGRFLRAEALLRSAVHSAEGQVKARFALQLASLVFSQGRSIIELAEPVANDAALPEHLRVIALSFLARSYANFGRSDEAMSAVQQLENFANRCSDAALAAQMLHRAGVAAVALSLPYATARSLFERAAALAREQGRYYTLASALGGLYAATILTTGDCEEGRRFAEEAMSAARRAGHRLAMETALLQLIEVLSYRGDVEEVEAFLTQVDAVASVEVGPPDRVCHVTRATTHGLLAAWKGDFARAYEAGANVDDRALPDFDRAMCVALRALYAAVCERTDRAAALVAQALQLVEASQERYFHAKILFDHAVAICAVASAVGERAADARQMLAAHPPLQHPAANAVRRAASALCAALQTATRTAKVDEALREAEVAGCAGIAIVFRRAADRLLTESSGEAQLTTGELAVLSDLSHGRNPKEIAALSGRSVHTVRTLAQRAIQKLGCSGRQQAIAAAQRRGLFKTGGSDAPWG